MSKRVRELDEHEEYRAVSVGQVPMVDDAVLQALGPDVQVVVDQNGAVVDLLSNQAIDEEMALVSDIFTELRTARSHFEPFHSPHEGAAILREEYEELWDLVKENRNHTRPTCVMRDRMKAEAVQIAAMAIRFIIDVCERKET